MLLLQQLLVLLLLRMRALGRSLTRSAAAFFPGLQLAQPCGTYAGTSGTRGLEGLRRGRVLYYSAPSHNTWMRMH